MTLPNEDFYIDYVFSCNRCKSCTQSAPPHLLPACPPFEMMGFFGYCGGGKAHIAQAIVEGKAGNLEELAEYYRMCSMCMACKEMCPIGLDHYYLIRDVRGYLFKNGVVHPEHERLLASVAKNNNPWSLPREEKGEWLLSLGVKDARKEPVENLYFAGCASGYRQLAGASAEAAVSLLRKAGIEVGCLGSDETCCGVFACELGDMKLFKKLARENAKRFKELGVKRVIVSDPHCYACFNNNYPEVVDYMPPVEHLFETLVPLVENGKMKPRCRLDGKVAYHDPCRLSRHTEAGGTPRKLLEVVLKEELIEMPRNRRSTYCCGNGPGVKEAHPEMMRFASGNRLNEAKDAGAEKLITACPYCMESLGRTGKENGGPECADLVRVLDGCF